MSKVKFKGFINGQEYDCYDTYITAKNAAVKAGVLRSCSEDWQTVETTGECYCDKTSCGECNCENCECGDGNEYPSNLMLFFEHCRTANDCEDNDYLGKIKESGPIAIENEVRRIKNQIPTLNECQLNEFIDDVDYVMGIIADDGKYLQSERVDLENDIEETNKALCECRDDLMKTEKLLQAYSQFRAIAMNVLRSKIVEQGKVEEHKANEERLRRNVQATELPSKKEAQYNTSFSENKPQTEGNIQELDDMLKNLFGEEAANEIKSFAKKFLGI